MTIDVTAVNDLPTAADKTVTATEDTALVFAVADFGFTDVETDQLQSITVAMLPSTGTLALNLFGEPLDTMEAIDFYANYNSITETTDLQDFFGDDRGFDLVQVGDKVSFSLDPSKQYEGNWRQQEYGFSRRFDDHRFGRPGGRWRFGHWQHDFCCQVVVEHRPGLGFFKWASRSQPDGYRCRQLNIYTTANANGMRITIVSNLRSTTVLLIRSGHRR